MIDKRLLVAGIILCAAFSTSAEAKLYKWVDNQGVTHYSSTIPPEYSNKDHVQINEAGREVRPEEKKPPKDAKPTPEEQAAIEQRRKDKALLDTYSNISEIDLARDRNLQQANARVNSIKIRLKSAQSSFDAHQKEKEHITKAGRKIPPSLHNDLANDQAALDRLQGMLDQAQQTVADIKARYDADKARYRSLTGQ
jgi:chromosome segregation ATPase